MKKIYLSLFVCLNISILYAQNNVGVGTLTPNSQAILEIQSDDKGVLISRLTTVSRNTLGTSLTAAEDGMLVYDKDLTAFYYWDGPNLQWVQVGSGTGDNWGTQLVQTSGANISGDGTTGNPIIVTDGDTDATNEIELPATAVTGQVLSWDGTNWVAQNATSGADNWGSQTVVTSGANITGDGTTGSPITVTDGDSDATNEIELPTGGTNGQVLSTDGSGTYTWISDDGGTDDQNIANLAFDNTTNILTVGIENGNSQTIDLSSLVDDADNSITNEIQDLSINTTTNILTITNNGSATNIDLSSYLDNTDNQDLTLVGNTLSLTNDGTTVDLSGYMDNTDAQNITGSSFTTSTGNLVIGISNGTNQTVNLNGLKDHDWYEVGTTRGADNINDNIFTQGKVGVGTATPTEKLTVVGTDGIPTVHIGGGDGLDFHQRFVDNEAALQTTINSGIDGGNLLLQPNNGNVGVGLVNPLTKLHAAGSIRSSSSNGYMEVSDYGGVSNFGFQLIQENLPSGSGRDMVFNNWSNLSNEGGWVFTNSNDVVSEVRITKDGKLGLGANLIPTEKLEVNGSVKIVDGTQGVNKVLTSDANGKASWQTPSGGYRQVYTLPAVGVIYSNAVTTVMGFSTINLPYSGFYLVNFKSFFKIPISGHHSYYIDLYINGVFYSTTETYATVSANSYMNVTDVYTLSANAGDVLELRIRPQSGGANFEVVNTLAYRVKFDLLYLGR